MFANKIPTFSKQVNGMAGLADGNSVIIKALFSSTWESIDQNFYTKVAQTIDPIDSTITFYGEILSSGILKAFDKDGSDVSDTDELVKLLRNPNPNQNQKEFLKEWLYYHYSHGWNYVVPQSSSVGYEKKLDKPNVKIQVYNVDPDNMVWGSLWDSFLNFLGINKKNIKFSYAPLGFKDISYADVIPFFDVRQNPEKPYMGISRLLAMKQNIQNYIIALQAKENMLKRSGSQLISLDAAKTDDFAMDSMIGSGKFDDAGDQIMITQKDKIEEQIQQTGIGNNSMGIIFANLPLKVQSLSDGLEKIDYDAQSVQDARVMMNKFNLPKEFQNLTTEAAKFQNRQKAMEEVIQNTIEPLGNSFCDKMRTFFNWENRIVLDFSHLPVFSENESTRTATQQAMVNLYIGLLEKNVIDLPGLISLLSENGINIPTKASTGS